MAISNNYYIRTIDSIFEEEWDRFVFNHPRGNIFQTSLMYRVFENTRNYEPKAIALLDDSGNILALTQVHIIREIKGPLGNFTSRAVMTGGPLYIEGEEGKKAVQILMEQYGEIMKKKALYTQIRNMWDTEEISNIIQNSGFKYEEHLNFLIDLTKNRDELWKNLNKYRKRGINKCYNLGCIVEEVQDNSTIHQMYNVLKDTYSNAKLPLADITLFESVFSVLVPQNMAKYWVVKYEDNIIGMALALIYKGTIFIWYFGALREALKFHPSDVLPWHIIEWGSNNKLNVFDFGGAGRSDDDYGVREFKRRFGGELVNHGRYTMMHSPVKYSIMNSGLKIAKLLMF